jgi:hypothetical protein
MVVDLIVATWRWQNLILWLPAIVLGAGLVCGVLILLGRAFVDNIRTSGHRRLILGGFVALVGAVLVLTWLGVELPRE